MVLISEVEAHVYGCGRLVSVVGGRVGSTEGGRLTRIHRGRQGRVSIAVAETSGASEATEGGRVVKAHTATAGGGCLCSGSRGSPSLQRRRPPRLGLVERVSERRERRNQSRCERAEERVVG